MPAPIDLQPYATQIGTAIATVVAVVVAVLRLNRSASKTQTEIGEDKASQNILTVALKQRDEALEAARVAWAQRTADAIQIATLMTEKTAWERERIASAADYMELESLCRRAARELHRVAPETATIMFPSDWMRFDPNPHFTGDQK